MHESQANRIIAAMAEQNKILADIAESLRKIANPPIIAELTSADVKAASLLGMFNGVEPSAAFTVNNGQVMSTDKPLSQVTFDRVGDGIVHALNYMLDQYARKPLNFQTWRVLFLDELRRVTRTIPGHELDNAALERDVVQLTRHELRAHYDNWLAAKTGKQIIRSGIPKREHHPRIEPAIKNALIWLDGQKVKMRQAKALEGYAECIRLQFGGQFFSMSIADILEATYDVTANSFESHYENWINKLDQEASNASE